MNGNPQNERLSAYYDNQLPLDERVMVEQELAASPEMRQEIGEYGQISGLLKSLPQTPAPIELKASILRAIERESLLAVADTARPRRLGRLLFTTAAAACAVAAVGYFAFSGRNGDEIAKNGKPTTPTIVTGGRGESEKLANKIQHNKLQFSRDDLKQAEIGDVVKAVTKSGNAVSVIRLTVVGVEHNIGELRVLLAGNQTGAPVTQTDGGVVAVYLQADAADFSKSLAEVIAKLDPETLSVSEPISADKLDDEQRKLVAGSNRKVETVTLKAGTPLEQAITTEAASKAADSNQNDGPARVLFVLTSK